MLGEFNSDLTKDCIFTTNADNNWFNQSTNSNTYTLTNALNQ